MLDRSSLLLSTWSSAGKLNVSPSLARKSSSLQQMMLRRLFFVAGSSSRTTLNFPEIAAADFATSAFLTTLAAVMHFVFLATHQHLETRVPTECTQAGWPGKIIGFFGGVKADLAQCLFCGFAFSFLSWSAQNRFPLSGRISSELPGIRCSDTVSAAHQRCPSTSA